jgi:hypothetical protein
MIDRATAGITDPAELFAVGTRITGRLGWTHPDIAGSSPAPAWTRCIPGGLAPRALRDIQAGQAAGRFTVPDAEIALSAVAGGMLGLLRMCQYHPDRSQEASADQLAQEASADQLARLCCVCSASPLPKPPASPPSRFPPLMPGNTRDDASGRGPASTSGWPWRRRRSQAAGYLEPGRSGLPMPG